VGLAAAWRRRNVAALGGAIMGIVLSPPLRHYWHRSSVDNVEMVQFSRFTLSVHAINQRQMA
jgi:hypothetical protein